ncbi:MAG: FHA domain-containing protein [Microbacteriaceae bacterium]|jgi:hypothetical protein|nr:FHA domain-containing protein [Microbacteriaceae bacterium]HPZ34627.1 FHA domain-containing protein [Microbacteriaceae bacterium]
MNPINADELTTHANWGAGDPHLLVRKDYERITFSLVEDDVTIGSSADASLQLAGIDPIHARIHHTPQDEYRLTMIGQGVHNVRSTASGVGSNDDHSEILRTGARFTLGKWELVFVRAEFADHGRPYGGRQGGEGTKQKPQPARPDYAHGGTVDDRRPLEAPQD